MIYSSAQHAAKFGRKLKTIILVSTAMAGGFATQAWGQAPGSIPPPPVRQPVDENGVDVIRGAFRAVQPAVTIGPDGPRGLSSTNINYNSGWFSSERASIFQSGSTYSVTLEGATDTFTLSGGVYTPTEANGSSLTFTGGVYTYTNRDGIVVAFQANSLAYPFWDQGIARATSITYPDGSRTALFYKIVQYCPGGIEGGICPAGYYYAMRLQSVTNNAGYQIKLTYATNTLNDLNIATSYDNWSRVTSARAINNAVEYCDPAADSCTLTNSWPSLSYGLTNLTSGGVQWSVTDSASNVSRYTSDSSYRLTGIKRPGASTDSTVISYGSYGVSAVTREGVNYSYSYVLAGSTVTTTVTDPASKTRVYVGDVNTNLIQSFKDELNNVTSYQYDTTGRLTRITYPEGNYVQYTYDGRGNVLETRAVAKVGSGLSDIVTTASFPTTCTNAKTCNKPLWTRDPASNQTDYVYDSSNGGLVSVTLPAPTTGANRPQTRYSYTSNQAFFKNSAGSIVASGYPISTLTSLSACQTAASCTGTSNETKTTVNYGPQVAGTANNLLPVSTSSGSGDGTLTATTSYTYDSIGNRLTVDGPLAGAGDTTRTRYDVLRRIIGVVGPDPDGSGSLKYRAQRLTYNADSQINLAEAGTVNSQSDADWANFASLQQVTTSYDSNARKTKDVVSAPSTSTTLAVTQYSYDNLGRTQCVAQRMNSSVWGTQTSGCTPNTSGSAGPDRIQRTSYNGASQVTSVELGVGTSVASTSASTGYTANGQLSYLTDGMGNKTTFEYDGFDRLLKTRYPSPTQGSGTSSTTDYQQANYDSRSNVTSLRLRDGQSVAMTYDNLSRLTLRDMPGTEPDITYGYDLLSRMTSASQTGNALSFTYDALSRNLTQVGPLGTMSYQYDLAGRRTRVTWPDALYVAYDYDLLNEMTAVRENGATSGVGVLATYTYNDLGFRTAQTGGNGTSTSYTPDALSRITQLSLDASGTSNDLTLGFTYNPASQIATRTANNDAYAWTGAVSSTKSYTANGLNQYLTAGGVSPTYDTKGNLTNDGSGSYTYSSMNMLVGATVGSTTTALAYDPLARLYQTAGASTIRLLYDGQNLVGEYNTSGTLLRRYVPGPGIDQPVLWYEGSGTTDRRWLHADERGSVIATSNGSAVVTAINAYDEWGVPRSGNVGRYQYTGQTLLSEVGLYNYKARFYNHRFGRFMQADPVGYQDNTNLYAYVANDPVNAIDPTGTLCEVWMMRTPNEKNGNGDLTITAPSFQFQCKGFGLWTEPKAGDFAGSGGGAIGAEQTRAGSSSRTLSRKNYCDGYNSLKAAAKYSASISDASALVRAALSKTPAQFLPQVQGYLRASQLIEGAGLGGAFSINIYLSYRYGDYAASAQAISDIFVGSTVAKAYKRYGELMGSSNKSLTADLLGTIFGAGVDFGKSGPCSGGN